jgi:hypothetical protein
VPMSDGQGLWSSFGRCRMCGRGSVGRSPPCQLHWCWTLVLADCTFWLEVVRGGAHWNGLGLGFGFGERKGRPCGSTALSIPWQSLHPHIQPSPILSLPSTLDPSQAHPPRPPKLEMFTVPFQRAPANPSSVSDHPFACFCPSTGAALFAVVNSPSSLTPAAAHIVVYIRLALLTCWLACLLGLPARAMAACGLSDGFVTSCMSSQPPLLTARLPCCQ